MNGEVSRSQDAPAKVSWRQVAYALLASGVALGGLWLNSHLAEVAALRSAVLTNQQTIIQHGERLQIIYENSKEAKRWREEEREWRIRIEEHVEQLRRDTGARRTPGFSRDSQTHGTRQKWDH